MTPSGIEPATFRFVAQHLNQEYLQYFPYFVCDVSEIRCIMSLHSALYVLDFAKIGALKDIFITAGDTSINPSLLCTCIRHTISARNAVEHF